MKKINLRILLFSVFCASFLALQAELRLPALFGDGMVVQHDQSFRIWGLSAPSAQIQIDFAEIRESVQADELGKWSARFAPPPAGGPYVLTVSDGESERIIKDVLSGEVWLCSGQSNMEWSLRRTEEAEAYIAQANYPQIRLFKIPRLVAHEPQYDVDAEWVASTPETAAEFSAVGWHFAREIHSTQNIPVGIIQAAWGGTYVQAWTDFKSLQTLDFMQEEIAIYKKNLNRSNDLSSEERDELNNIYRSVMFLKDPGNRGFFMNWHSLDFDDSQWDIMKLPTSIEKVGYAVEGAFWFRLNVNIPSSWKGRNLVLKLGKIDDYDITYFNGKKVGVTDENVPNAWDQMRSYSIPEEIVHFGDEKNLIAVRMFDRFGAGGLLGPENAMRIGPENGEAAEFVSLAGDWHYEIELKQISVEDTPLVRSIQSKANQPGVLYNAMIHPLIPYAMRGVLWYQGESNAGKSDDYKILFPKMIQQWRADWDQGDFPFYYVQLANFQALQNSPAGGGWGAIREAQQAALKLPNVAEAIILDVGDANDIHPRDKYTPAQRLALHARSNIYGETIPHSSPYLKEWALEGNKIRLHFTHTYGELKTRDGEAPRGFAILGDTGEWHWAEVDIIDSETILLSHPKVSTPQAARYAWASNPIGNMTNRVGLPMSPFRTDN